MFIMHQELPQGAWRSGSVVKSTGCSSRETGSVPSIHMTAHNCHITVSVTPVPGDLNPFSGTCGYCIYKVHIHAGKIPIHINLRKSRERERDSRNHYQKQTRNK